MRRRNFLRISAAAPLAMPLVAAAQPAGKIVRVGRLAAVSAVDDAGNLDAFRRGMRDLGWVEGRNLAIESRFGDGVARGLPTLAAELVRSNVDVIVASSSDGARAAKNATSTIPVVFTMTGDPLEGGIVASLARPGANVTGVTTLGLALAEKRLEILKEAVPGVRRIAALSHPEFPDAVAAVKRMEPAARALGVRLHVVEVRDPARLDQAFNTMRSEQDGALTVLAGPLFVTHRKRIVDLAVRSRLPAIYSVERYVEVGGLLFYGESLPDLYYRSATLVDKILKGARPGDIPVEQATKLDLIINLKAASQIGLTIPAALLRRASRVIQ
jgi:putative tryptophan/tyrosine transport system substrate-binding protein